MALTGKMRAAVLALLRVEDHKVYLPGSRGPFRCDHCEYYVEAYRCGHPEIIKLRQGAVEPDGCSDFFQSK